MSDYEVLERNRFFEIMDGLNRENQSDFKVNLLCEVDMTSAQKLRVAVETATGVRPSYTALLAKAIAQALHDHPQYNRVPFISWWKKRIVQMRRIDITVAVERDQQTGFDQAAFAHTVRDTDTLDVADITRQLRSVATSDLETNQRWRQFQWIVRWLPTRLAMWVLSMPLHSPTLWVQHRGGSVLISSPAKYGVDALVASWAWPLSFSFGLVKDRVVAVDGKAVVRPTMSVGLSFDRRLMGGAPASRLMHIICEHLEQAEIHLGLGHTNPTAQETGNLRLVAG